MSVGEARIGTAEDLTHAINDARVGATVELGVVRAGERRTVEVRLARRPG